MEGRPLEETRGGNRGQPSSLKKKPSSERSDGESWEETQEKKKTATGCVQKYVGIIMGIMMSCAFKFWAGLGRNEVKF